jgi:hypothetical protein
MSIFKIIIRSIKQSNVLMIKIMNSYLIKKSNS